MRSVIGESDNFGASTRSTITDSGSALFWSYYIISSGILPLCGYITLIGIFIVLKLFGGPIKICLLLLGTSIKANTIEFTARYPY